MTTDHVISCEGFDIIISFKVNVVKHGQNSVGADLLGIKSPRSTTGNKQDVYKEHKSGVYKEIDQTDDKKSMYNSDCYLLFSQFIYIYLYYM